ncbi:hypothetical protein GCM10010521_25630 [Streptomyces rameus]|uniref:Uncharacterized protein n=1 Tax=Streptomyces rameus TaxID=68261 RepID=A0ABP6N719_9ACTN
MGAAAEVVIPKTLLVRQRSGLPWEGTKNVSTACCELTHREGKGGPNGWIGAKAGSRCDAVRDAQAG